MRRLVLAALGAVVLAGCVSKNSVEPVKVVKTTDEAMTCEAIHGEIKRNYVQMLRADENIDGADGRNATKIAAFIVGTLLVGPGPGAPSLDSSDLEEDLLLDYSRRNKRLHSFAQAKQCPPLPPMPAEVAEALSELGTPKVNDLGEIAPQAGQPTSSEEQE